MEGGRVDGAGADRVVGAAVTAGFSDRKQLDEPKTNPARPDDELPERFEIADPEIVFRTQGEKWSEDPGESIVRRKIHSLRMTNDEARNTKQC